MKRTITQKEIAGLLGINQATVSCAFTDSAKVGRKMRERIRETAFAMGYRPNAGSRAIRRGRTDTIAVLLSTEGCRSYLPPTMLNAILHAAEGHGKLVILSRFTDSRLTSEEHMPRVLAELSADGLILNYSHMIPPGLDALLERYRIPAVWINRDGPSDCVCPDDRAGAAMAVRGLHEMGHRRIAFLHTFPSLPPAEDPHSVGHRLGGYRQGMAECGLEPLPPGILDCPHEAKRQAFHAWWEAFGEARPTAVLGYQHPDATFCAMQLSARGLRVPDDVSLVMFGDHEDRSMGVQFDHIVLPEEEIGQIAVDMLLAKIAVPAQAIPSRRTTPVWILGESCRPLAGFPQTALARPAREGSPPAPAGRRKAHQPGKIPCPPVAKKYHDQPQEQEKAS